MTTLGQIVGIHKSTRTQIQREWDEAYKTLQKPNLFNGFTKSHTPFEGNLQQPEESNRVQANATEIVGGLEGLLTRLFDLEATKDTADTLARSDVLVAGSVILSQVPVNHLLWLEKQVTNLLNVFRAIPVQSAAEEWHQADNLPKGMWRTTTKTTPSTKKESTWEVIVPAAANGQHPADVRQVSRDLESGTWEAVKFTAAMPSPVKTTLVNRASALLDGVKQAIVAANHLEVTDVQEGGKVFGYLFDNLFSN